LLLNAIKKNKYKDQNTPNNILSFKDTFYVLI